MPAPPRYLVALCEADRCAPLPLAEGVPADEAEAGRWLAAVAGRLRELGHVGRAVLLDARSRRIVAERPVWPVARRGEG